MITESLYELIVWSWGGLALLIFIILLFVKSPYGRHYDKKKGLTINSRLGWILMETPVLMMFLLCLFIGDKLNLIIVVISLFFLIHYINRILIYPFRIKAKNKKMPLLVVLMAVGFNLMNGFLNGWYLGHISGYQADWFYDIRFICGSILFITGLIINWHSDSILLKLRSKDETGYKIPYGGLFKYVSCPNFLGEIIEWSGFALLCWNIPAMAFSVWTIANLIPRSLDHHRWYINNFNDYPADRRAILPFIL